MQFASSLFFAYFAGFTGSVRNSLLLGAREGLLASLRLEMIPASARQD